MVIEERLKAIEDAVMKTNRLLSTLFEEQRAEENKRIVHAYMNVDDASRITGLSVRTIRQYCNKGEIEYTKCGNRIIVHTESLLNYIRRNSRKTIKESAEELQVMLNN